MDNPPIGMDNQLDGDGPEGENVIGQQIRVQDVDGGIQDDGLVNQGGIGGAIRQRPTSSHR